jgi:3-phosphoshikimate 1-carboxyvinyltransferase
LLDAHVTVPASKSVANRELVLSAQAKGRSRLELGPDDPGDDVHTMYDALAALGHDVKWAGHRIDVTAGETPNAHVAIDARDAGTVARFVAALAATTEGTEVRIDGSPRMRERPITSLVQALRELGASIDGDRLPLVVRGPLSGGEVSIAGYESSQFASALLLVGARTAEGLRLRLTGDVVSAPFIDLTIAALEKRGVAVQRPTSRSFVVAPHQVKARTLVVPGDATAATYPAAAAAILCGSVTIDNVSAKHEPGGQGDVRFFDLIEDMGCIVKRGSSTTVRRSGALYGIVANVSDCSDVFPTLAVIATQAETPTELSGLGHTRRQESDRPAVVAAAINALGGRAQAFGDAIRIEPAQLHDGIVDSARDHRIAMAFSILGLQIPGIAIAGSDAVSKTFPGFYDMLEDLRR